MNFIALDQIIIPENRIRREFPLMATLDLAESIRSKGLLHPIVLQNDCMTLVAGERRLRAMTELVKEGHHIKCNGFEAEYPDLIPYTVLGELTPAEIREAELEENTRRVDLTWQERNRAQAELHALRLEQNPAQTFIETAREIAGPAAPVAVAVSVSEAVTINRFLDDPDVVAAPTEKQALRIIKLKTAAKKREALASTYDMSRSLHIVQLGNARELLPELTKDKNITVLVTDPPYGVNADTFNGQGSFTHTYADDQAYFETEVIPTLQQALALCAQQAHAYIFFDLQQLELLRTAVEAVDGWKCWRNPIIVDNRGSGIVARPHHTPRHTYDFVLYALRNDKPVLLEAQPDVIASPTPTKVRPAEKTVEAYRNLLARSIAPGEWALDPFAGTGPILAAAQSLTARAIAIDRDPAAIDICLERANALLGVR